MANGYTKSGPYTISLGATILTQITVSCDMDMDGGGWLVCPIVRLG